MAENPSNRDGRGAADPFDTIERLTPSPAVAIEGMRSSYLSAFRSVAGVGSNELALLAWARWSTTLLDCSGLHTADRKAEDAVLATRRLHLHWFARLWVTDGMARAAARHASREAASCP